MFSLLPQSADATVPTPPPYAATFPPTRHESDPFEGDATESTPLGQW